MVKCSEDEVWNHSATEWKTIDSFDDDRSHDVDPDVAADCL